MMMSPKAVLGVKTPPSCAIGDREERKFGVSARALSEIITIKRIVREVRVWQDEEEAYRL